MGRTQDKGQSAEPDLTAFLDPLHAVQNLLDAFGGRGVIIGGIAASLLGKPRFTADVDAVLLLELDEPGHLLEKAAELGMETRITAAEAFARRNRVLLLRHAASGIDVDISLGILPFEVEMVERSRRRTVGGLQLCLPTAEDLIILKAVAHRPKDLQDIESVMVCQPDLDKERIRHWVSQFAEALEMLELWEDLAARLGPSVTPAVA